MSKLLRVKSGSIVSQMYAFFTFYRDAIPNVNIFQKYSLSTNLKSNI